MDDAERKKHYESMKLHLNKFIDDFGDSDGVYDILYEFLYLWNDQVFEELFALHESWEKESTISWDTRKMLEAKTPIFVLARKRGMFPGRDPINYLLDYETFEDLHVLLEKLYSRNIGKKLTSNDLLALYNGDVVERLLCRLEDFDALYPDEHGNSKIPPNFFRKVQKITWDVKAKKLLHAFHDIIISLIFQKPDKLEKSFKNELEQVAVLLAYSSAMQTEHLQIITEDVLRAYNTLFKLITTDISSFVDKTTYSGVLICGDCGKLYELQSEESPYDYKGCECGGSLNYLVADQSNAR